MRSLNLVSVVAVVALAAAASGCLSPVRQRPSPVPPSAGGSSGRSAPVPGTVSGRIAMARSLLGSAYRYGGETPRGFDCSGFARYVFEEDGLSLPRTATEQAEVGRWVPLDELDVGDLVFFSDVGSKPHHVGLVVSRPGEPLRMIHASTSRGVVETDVLAGTYWLRRLRFGRRVAEPTTSAR